MKTILLIIAPVVLVFALEMGGDILEKNKKVDPWEIGPKYREAVTFFKVSIVAYKTPCKEEWRKDFAILDGYRNGIDDLVNSVQKAHPDLDIVLETDWKSQFQCEYYGVSLIPLD